MRTALFLVAGLLLLAAALILGRLFSANYPAATTWATGVFVVLWLALSSFNMWVGVARAGYSAAEELPIMLIIFGVPVVLALVLNWKIL